METSFTNQEQVSTDSEDDETVDELISHGKKDIITMIDEAFAGINPFDETPEDDPTKQTKVLTLYNDTFGTKPKSSLQGIRHYSES